MPTVTVPRKSVFVYSAIFDFLLGVVFLAIGIMFAEVRVGFIVTAVILWTITLPFLLVGRIIRRARTSLASLDTTKILEQLSAQGFQLPGTGATVTIDSQAPVTVVGGERLDRLRSAGVDGTATIKRVVETGLNFGGTRVVKLELHVEAPGHEAYNLVKSTVVPEHAGSGLAAGQTVPVKVDPVDPFEVAIDWELEALDTLRSPAVSAAPAASALTPPVSPPSGWQTARVTVLDFQDTGGGSGAELELRFRLRITQDGQPREETYTERLPRNVANRLVKGQSFAARIDPDNPSRVRVDWEGR